MKIVNYTPHDVVVENGDDIYIYPESRLKAQVKMLPVPADTLEDGCPTCHIEYGEALLPAGHDPEAYAVVSTMFADAYRRQHGYDSIQLLVPDSGPSATRKDGQVASVRHLIRR
jgi:hypothetical protein